MDSLELKDFARSKGANLVGICSVDAINMNASSIKAILPDAKSIIVVGIKHSISALDSENIHIKQYNTLTIYREIDMLENALTRLLEEKGFKAVPVPPYFPVKMYPEKGIAGEISHKHAAVEAGLGEIGLNGLLITPEFGPRVRLGSVLTDALLEPDKRLTEGVCIEDCMECVKACPARAISPDGKVDITKCYPYVGRYHNIPELIVDMKAKSEEEIKEIREMLRTPRYWDFYQQLVMGTIQYCFNCQSSCPVGRK